MRKLSDILVCPICKSPLTWGKYDVSCKHCGAPFPVIENVPVFVDNPPSEHPPTRLRENYDEYVAKPILATLDRRCVVLDIGSGNMKLDHPNIVRVERAFGPYVDVVADAVSLPFKDDVADLVLCTGLLEHLDDPFKFAMEAFRVCSRGGYIYAETNFVWPYHGYPHHYFNFSVSGVEKVFSQFRRIRSGVPAHGMPSFALAAIIDTYLALMKPQSRIDLKLVRALKRLKELPLGSLTFGKCFDPESAKILAGVVFFYGMKQTERESVIPTSILEAYYAGQNLQKRFCDPYDLLNPDNIWNALRHVVDLERYYADKQIFGKRGKNSGAISDTILV